MSDGVSEPAGGATREEPGASVDDPVTRPRFAVRSLHVLVLWSLAVAQPLFDVLSNSPEFFVAHRASGLDLLFVILILILVLPLPGLLGCWVLGRFDERLRELGCDVIVALLVGLLAMQAVPSIGVPPVWILLAVAALVGIGVVLVYRRFAGVRMLLTFLSPCLLVFPLLFLFGSPLGGLVWPVDEETPAGEAEFRASTPVVIVIFDQLPVTSLMNDDGRIDAELYPNFAALAEDSTWYRNATSVANKSAWAIPSILTGRYPDPEKRLPNWINYPDNLLTALAPHYEPIVFEPVTELCPQELCNRPRPPLHRRLTAQLSDMAVVYAHIVAPPEIAERLPPVTENWKGFGLRLGPRTIRNEKVEWRRHGWTQRWVDQRESDRHEKVLRFVDRIDADTLIPPLVFAHVLLPHEPFLYLPSGRFHTTESGSPGLQSEGFWIDEEFPVAQIYRRHLLQLAHVDRLLGEIVDRLEEVGLYERSVLVVTADHGASFVPGESFKRPNRRNYVEIMAVPLLIKEPGQSDGRIDDAPAETIDIVPTLADVLDYEIPWPMDGEILGADAPIDRTRQTIFYGAAHGKLEFPVENFAAKRAIVDRKMELFADGDPTRPRYLPHADLIGRRVDTLRVSDRSPYTGRLETSQAYLDVDIDSRFVPARVAGTIETTAPTEESLPVVVAIDGVVRSTARSFAFDSTETEKRWSAMVPESAFREGFNAVEVFVPVVESGETVLYRVRSSRGVERIDNLILPRAEWSPDVELTGFYSPEGTGEELIRWTDGLGRVHVRIDADHPPDALRLSIRRVPPGGGTVEVRVDDCTIYRDFLTGPVEEILEFRDCELEGEILEIAIESDTFVPASTAGGNPNDGRRLGVALEVVELRRSEGTSSSTPGTDLPE